MNASRAYLLLAAAGLLLPWYFNLAYLGGGGSLAPGAFLAAVSANALTSAITWDVYIAAAVASVWMVRDAPRSGVRRPWLYVVLCFAVGLAFAYPLYLARREAAGADR
ncbi:DUF2834 domain-containing protein [Ramlibacter sp.]|uniref:DUF2834 domain-containing protein n=1 Tax=Ramlibacter sp. TaxID=1917967 RepID=UPI0017F01FE1|nr:DUF2834 domain-containing protein [Ramlibacter sp.]MBA2676473.1 DUF2834 domain-containing protein [Ramlibacter sp.]